MRSSAETYTITEFDGFTRGKALGGRKGLPDKTFDALETFILTHSVESGTDALELLSLSARRGIGKIITAKNYVGLITMSDGTVIEILPKIVGKSIGIGDTKRVFLEMLKTLRDVSFKDFNVSNLKTERLSLFEIFIKMFLDEVSILTKQGLKAAYIPIESNERFYKGKLLVPMNIKYNLVNKERFFVRFDDFNIDRPENRLIKSTLSLLLKYSGDNRNRMNASRLLSFFEGVQYSDSYESDFTKCEPNRNMTHYSKAISWCRVFLHGNSFTAYAGSEVALALLFPMEKVFESYIAAKIREHLGSGTRISIQDRRYSLFDRPTRAFALRPDIVLESSAKTVVMDTKWKLLSSSTRNNGISQSDMYQMYAYSKKYNADKIMLLYPLSDAIDDLDINYVADDNVTVEVAFIDLMNTDHDINEVLLRCKELQSGE
jgi:5-methylcytosine-specific restriction enzyme subunit McrC